MSRNQLGRDVFVRGQPEAINITRQTTYEVSLYELLKAYAHQRTKRAVADIRIHKREVMTLEQALDRLSEMMGQVLDWTSLESFLPPELADTPMSRSAKASLFTASLELARQGKAELVQKQVFGPLYIRNRKDGNR